MVDWVKTNKLKSVIISILGFVGATYFHGAMFIGGFLLNSYWNSKFY